MVTEPNTTSGTDNSFGRRFRLADKACFGRVFEKAGRSRDKMFTVLYRHNNTNETRLGLAIGKKNCRLATGRNRLKRVIRESFRKQKRNLHGLDLVVLNHPAATRANNKTLFLSLEDHWRRCSGDAAHGAGTK